MSSRRKRSRKQQCGSCTWWSHSIWARMGECSHPVSRVINLLVNSPRCPEAVDVHLVYFNQGKHCPCFERAR